MNDFPKVTVFQILIEAYRLLDEERRISSGQLVGVVKSEPKVQYITGFSFAGLQAFLQLSLDPTTNLFRAEIPASRLPRWWNAEKKSACEADARQLYHWSDLKMTPAIPAEVDDFRRFGGVGMRPTLRFLAMWVTGKISSACELLTKTTSGRVVLAVVPKEDLDPTRESNEMLRDYFGLG